MTPIRTLKADILLLITAAVWGFAFVAQRAGMEYVGPFTYNAVRFALGGFSLLPLLAFRQNQRISVGHPSKPLLLAGMATGLALFLGSSFQQVGLQYTTAGNAGFITGLYVIIVPLIGLFFKERAGKGVWIGALLAVAGMYFLSVTDNLSIGMGDMLVLICAFFFAFHLRLVSRFSPLYNAIRLSIIQFFTTSVLSFLIAVFYEEILWQDIFDAAIPILYGGIFSAGVAYTLQIIAQKDAPGSHAAILLSMESVFAVIGGWWLLSETITLRVLLGAGLMLGGMLSAQLYRLRKKQLTR